MKKHPPEVKEQAIKLLESDPKANAATVSRAMGISHATVKRWFAEYAKTAAERTQAERLREAQDNARRMLEETPTFKTNKLRNHFRETQFELLQRHASDLTALRARQLKAVLDNDPQMTRAVASAMLAVLKAQDAERMMYDIKPGTESTIMERGANAHHRVK